MYSELEAHVAALKKAGFLEDGAKSLSLEEVINLGQIDVLRKVAKIFRVDHKQVGGFSSINSRINGDFARDTHFSRQYW